MAYINCEVFNKNGKWYNTEKVYVRDDTPDCDIVDQIYQNRDIEDMIYVGRGMQHKPLFLVNVV
jgi:hypothetical protein